MTNNHCALCMHCRCLTGLGKDGQFLYSDSKDQKTARRIWCERDHWITEMTLRRNEKLRLREFRYLDSFTAGHSGRMGEHCIEYEGDE